MKNKIWLVFLSAVAIALAFHPLHLSFLAWFGLVPLLFTLESAAPRRAFLYGLVFGALVALFSLFWLVFLQIPTAVKILMVFGLVLLFLYLGLFWAVACLIANRTTIWLLPAAVAGLEYVRGLGELGFPWLTFGYTQARYPLIIQQASIYGVLGVSFWLVLINLLVYRLLCHHRAVYALALTLAIALPMLYGALRLRQTYDRYVVVGVIQPNIDPNMKLTRGLRAATFDCLLGLTRTCHQQSRDSLDQPCDLIVWPESAVPVLIRSSREYRDLVLALADSIQTPILIGSPVIDRVERKIYNAAILAEPGLLMEQEYRKIHLVPFGEHIPFDRWVPLFRKIDLGEGDYSAGSNFTIFKTRAGRYACLICFESIFPELSREFCRRGAAVLLNITNDGWFGPISGPQQHNDMAILRAVENGRPLARSANTGISMVVDSRGRILRELPLFKPGYIVCRLPLDGQVTFYQRTGDFLPILCLIVLTAALLLTRRPSHSKI